MGKTKNRNQLVNGIINRLNELGVSEVCWSDVNCNWSPILQKDKFNVENTFGVDWVTLEGVEGSSSWDNGYWDWNEVPMDALDEIYSQLLDYEID